MALADRGVQRSSRRVTILAWLFAFVVPAVSLLLPWGVLTVVLNNGRTWSGLVAAAVFVVIAFSMYPDAISLTKIARRDRSQPALALCSSLSFALGSVLTMATALACVSYVLHRSRVVIFTSKPANVSYSTLMKTYLWHFVEVLPLTNVEKTLGMKDPELLSEGWAAGAPVLCFRIFVAAVLLSVLKAAWETFQQDSPER